MPATGLPLDEAVELTRTGDLWLFRGRSAADRAIQMTTNSPVNHVGMAVVLDDLPPLMWHAELGRSLPDVWTGSHQRGVQLHDLRDAVLRLGAPLRPAGVAAPARPAGRPRAMEDARAADHRPAGRHAVPVDRAARRPLAARPAAARRAGAAARREAAMETAYCAEVVALTYEAMGLLPDGPAAELVRPGQLLERRRPPAGDRCPARWRDRGRRPAALDVTGPAPLTRPRRLSRGDRVAVVATSGPLAPDRLARGVPSARVLGPRGDTWGSTPSKGDVGRPSRRAPTKQRAADFRPPGATPAVRAVLCGRGGSGAARVVDLLDWTAMRAAGPRVLRRLQRRHRPAPRRSRGRLGLASLMGPMAANGGVSPSEPPRRGERRPAAPGGADGPAVGPHAGRRGRCVAVVRAVRARGPLVGRHHLAATRKSAGTADQVPATGAIAVLEDVSETDVPAGPSAGHPAAADRLVRRGRRGGAGHVEGCGPDAEE